MAQRADHLTCGWLACWSAAVMVVLWCPPVAADDAMQPAQEEKEKRLGERLIRKAVADADEDVMTTIIRLMNDASRRLEIEFDAGEETQALQRRITDRLDEAIQVAAARLHPGQPKPQPSRGDRRKMPTGNEKPGKPGDNARGDPQNGASSQTGRHEPRASVRADASEYEARRAWGHLPPRQRDEVIQGLGEGFLERYRSRIQRYYQALQEAEE